MTAKERKALDCVAARSACRVPELAQATGLSETEALDVLLDLEEEGLVVASVYRVTPEGREAAWR